MGHCLRISRDNRRSPFANVLDVLRTRSQCKFVQCLLKKSFVTRRIECRTQELQSQGVQDRILVVLQFSSFQNIFNGTEINAFNEHFYPLYDNQLVKGDDNNKTHRERCLLLCLIVGEQRGLE